MTNPSPFLAHLSFAIALLFGSLNIPSRADCASWFVLPGSPAQDIRHEDLAFLTPSLGWVVNGDGEIHKTTNGGVTWLFAAQLDGFLRSVVFVDSLHGWTGALFSPDSLLYETTDGGFTWTLESIPEQAPEGICGLFAVDSSVIYGCGRYNGPPRMIKTTDGGETWTSSDLSAYATTLVDCYFTSPDSGFVAGGIGTYPDSTRDVVLRTTDGGASWSAVHTGNRLKEWCWKISFPSPLVGYISLERLAFQVSFLKTTDGGATWSRKPFTSGGYYRAQGIGFADDMVGWIGGSTPMYATTDGGETWQTETWGQNVNQFCFTSDSLAYAVGKKVYKYDVNDPTWVDNENGGAGSSSGGATIVRSAPNPFRSDAAIDYRITAPEFVRLTVHDLAGARVATIAEGHVAPGDHRAVWNGRDVLGKQVASGTYLCRIEANSRAHSTRIVLIR
ncbi:MAG: FlgD immunoglobulin-like domain containing protein [bacterium]